MYKNTILLLFFVVGSNAFLSGFFNFIKDNTYCRYNECCNEYYVPYRLNDLSYKMKNKLFGQPLALHLCDILRSHKKVMDNNGNRKPLVISLHGWSGVGKNYITTIIAEELFHKGMKSEYVLLFQGMKAIDSGNVFQSRENMHSKIVKTVQRCPRALIIFDEVDGMDPAILERVNLLLDHSHSVDGVDFRDAIFIFISNIAGPEISERLLELYDEGITREEVEFKHFEPIIRKISFSTGGFDKTAMIAKNLIDHYIPFLPLEQVHIEKCVLAEFYLNHVYKPTKAMMEDAISVVTYGPTVDRPIFANNGCKRFTKHIPYIIEKHRNRRYSESKNEL